MCIVHCRYVGYKTVEKIFEILLLKFLSIFFANRHSCSFSLIFTKLGTYDISQYEKKLWNMFSKFLLLKFMANFFKFYR